MEILFLIGRILFGGLTVFFGVNHFLKLEAMSGYAQAKGVPAPKLAVLFTGLLLLLGGLSILLGLWVPWGVTLLLVFYLPVTFKMHDFWADTDPQMKQNNMIHFMKNLALAGALLMLLAIATPWPYSLAM